MNTPSRSVHILLFLFSLALPAVLPAAGKQAEPVAPAAITLPECEPRGGLPNFFAKLEAGGTVRIAYLGGSITEAAGWRVLSRKWFAEQYPQARVEEIRATMSGTGAEFGACRLQSHVLRHSPDLVFVEFAVNGAGATDQRAIRSVEGIVRQAEIAGDIRRAAGVAGFLVDLDDRHRGLGRDAGDFAPHEFIEHHIANDEEAAAFCGLKKML